MKVNPLADIQVFSLPHHGRLVCQVNSALPVAAVYAWVHAGSCHEQPPRELGIAHMVEHMLFKGTSSQGVGDLALAVEGAGGSLNAWTAHDETVLHAAGPSCAWKTFLLAITEALFHPAFDADELEREKEVVLEELRHGENSPIHRVSDRI
ncbi:insulinase family protein, partial [Myxococcota bacterium]|nr:insulinase family protein [Myxococcota bacterium]